MSRTIFSLALFLGSAFAQPSGGLIVRVQPSNRASELKVAYLLAGPFGGFGGPTTQMESGGVLIPTAYEGKPGKSLKAVLYLRGCQMQTLEIAKLSDSPGEVNFVCKPLPAITLSGTFNVSGIPLEQEAYVEAWYMGMWTNGFLGIQDGLVAQWPAGTGQVASGSFQLTIPDFSLDPHWSGSGRDAYLLLLLRDQKTGNVLGSLKPLESTGTSLLLGMKIAPVYPRLFELQLW